MHALDILGDPVRRRIVELLSQGESAAGDVGTVVQREFGISQPAVSQHLRVLREAGFARVRAEGTRRLYALEPAPLAEADAWLAAFRRFWQPPLDALGTELARGRRQRRLDAGRPAFSDTTTDEEHSRNIDGQIDGVTRAVSSTERDGQDVRVQSLTQRYPSPLDDVWDAVTSPERIGRWFLPVEGDLTLGGRYQFEGNAGGTILECEPPQADAAHYRITWEFGGGVTWVTVRLTALDTSSTSLELEHVAPLDAVPEELWNQFGPGATGLGWDAALLGLNLHLTAPGERPDDPMAWQVGPEGRRFNRLAADRWADAQVADGTPPEVARAAADAIYAMYVGEGPSGD